MLRVSVVSPGFIKTPMTDKNDFKMPMIKTPEFAANKMYKGLVNKKIFETHFPKNLHYLLSFLNYYQIIFILNLVKKGMKRKKEINL